MKRGILVQVRTLHRARLFDFSIFYTYVLRCRDGKLYVGSALDLRKRIAQHRARRVSNGASIAGNIRVL
jgi:hypothetical protein